ncbi:MAG: DUF4446 family protein [Lachnospiraceae bacterium]|nr:DUF4446 family protein [Lachnospiraceae bacterium]MBR3909864.1 DUF4446 family protein [Anaerotignum sp.]
MSSPLFEMIGLGNLDIAWLFIALFVIMITVIVMLAIQMSKLTKLKKKYAKFMKGSNGKSLEKDILALFEENKTISEENEKNRKEIKDLQRQIQYCYQKIGLVKYDAFNQMGGKLSFCLVLLNEKNNGFLLNSVHSSDGCYSYTKEITKGECELSLGEEEQKALDMAMKY